MCLVIDEALTVIVKESWPSESLTKPLQPIVRPPVSGACQLAGEPNLAMQIVPAL